MVEVIHIPYPNTEAGKKQWNKQYGLNSYYSTKHWSQRKKDADYWHMLTWAAMAKGKCRKTPFENPVILTFYFNDRLDCSNHAMYIKMIEDSMKGRIIQDDTRRWVKGIECYFHNEDHILVIVREA